MSEIRLPVPHSGQLKAWKSRGRFNAIRCGRRWGKSQLVTMIAAKQALRGRIVGIFAPDYRRLTEIYHELSQTLKPALGQTSRIEGVMRLKCGEGRIDYWTLNDPQAGRSRKYHTVLIDEAGYAPDEMSAIWERSIRPTLIDYAGDAWALSTPPGAIEGNWYYGICHSDAWTEYYAPAHDNPYLPESELEAIKASSHPDVYRQETLAEWVDWSGLAFFSRDNLLEHGQPVPMPVRCDVVFATIDTAVKTGREHDGTGVIFWSHDTITKTTTILDYDYVQVEGALLEAWLPSVYQRLDGFVHECGARVGSIGAMIEDKASGSILLQQALRHGWNARAIDSKLTSVGKDERAISVSGYVYRGLVKMTAAAHDRIVDFKGSRLNHLMSQVCGYRVGQKDAADDLLDCFTYGVAITCGDSQGY